MTEELTSNSTAVIVLAAGASSRLGQPKQLLKFKGKTLLRSCVETALSVSPNVVVVLGSQSEMFKQELENLPVHIVDNPDWQKGMGNSLKCGLGHLSKFNAINSVMVMVCDQPLLTTAHLKKLMHQFNSGSSKIVASSYQNTIGVPALFSIKLVEQLNLLDDQSGAKKIIQQYKADVAAVPFPHGEIDIDTPDDRENLLKNY